MYTNVIVIRTNCKYEQTNDINKRKNGQTVTILWPQVLGSMTSRTMCIIYYIVICAMTLCPNPCDCDRAFVESLICSFCPIDMGCCRSRNDEEE